MKKYDQIQQELSDMAMYWQLRKFQFLERASDEFDWATGGPHELRAPEFQFQKAYNLIFTEWLLFERVLWAGKTPVELYAAMTPVKPHSQAIDHMQQIAATHFFSTFVLSHLRPAKGLVHLRDVFSGEEYEVKSACMAYAQKWRQGTVSLRIAQVDGTWYDIAQIHFHDKADFKEVNGNTFGVVHPEDEDIADELNDMGFFARFARDVMGGGRREPQCLRITEHDPNEAA